MGVERKVYKVLVGKPEGKKELGRSRRRWGDVISLDLMDIFWKCGLDSVGSGYKPTTCSCVHGD
jgi:hypothetical protein